MDFDETFDAEEFECEIGFQNKSLLTEKLNSGFRKTDFRFEFLYREHV